MLSYDSGYDTEMLMVLSVCRKEARTQPQCLSRERYSTNVHQKKCNSKVELSGRMV
jgi:hypothetical protein